MKFDLKNGLIGGSTALLVILVIVALICVLEHCFFVAGIMAVMLVMSTFVLMGICND